MAYEQHVAMGLPMEFMKSDMYYFRAKIVSEIYIDKYVHWKLKDPNESILDQSAD